MVTLSFTIFFGQKILIEPICFFKFYAALSRFSIPHILMKSHILFLLQQFRYRYFLPVVFCNHSPVLFPVHSFFEPFFPAFLRDNTRINAITHISPAPIPTVAPNTGLLLYQRTIAFEVTSRFLI